MPTKPKKPMVAMSKPSTVNHACIACPVNANGKPEANPRNKMAVKRRIAERSHCPNFMVVSISQSPVFVLQIALIMGELLGDVNIRNR